ncbi:lytic transglycosylase [Neisseria wadsworthii]|uniref:Transglycosylase SLT/LysM domain protein n=1 Tax=Neisseria wadsworthii 9715 TaxID=1030841 RepID=G4CRC0_9NEIS|nr:LysM peptidoglycan-binding domain-containing protein [Neisseria wadsworthii]EGZ45393.1 transglycosylase SLT/LysM domain protein [Neisseria wadsworthii 9715]QMT35330.1 LysM peptidoglycan-binding domain-containing protein [Neisseria wadsworthii]
MASLKTISLAVAGLSISAASHAQTSSYSPNQVGMAMMRLSASPLDHNKKIVEKSGSIWAKMRKDFRMNEVNPELVRRHESKFSAGSAYFTRTIDRSKPYMSYIASEVEKRNMPAEIALLPFIESAYVTKAKSHVGASGLWQFMPATGRHYGLEQTSLYDGRHDVKAATDAALNYLQYLHGLFGDWSLALAAYNWGEGNVSRAVNRARAQGLEPVYENLRMPNETRNYVPKLMAVRNIVRDPQYYGINLAEIDSKPYFKAVTLDQPIDTSAAARLAGITESEFLALNPAFKAPVFVPNEKRKMLLPVGSVATFEKNYSKADKSTLLSWNVYQTQGMTSLASIAAETGTSLSELKRLNGIKGASVNGGYSLLVAKNGANVNQAADYTDFARMDKDLNPNDNKLQTVEPMQGRTIGNALAAAQPVMPKPVVMAQKVEAIPASKAEPVSTAPVEGFVAIASNKPTVNELNAPVNIATNQPLVSPLTSEVRPTVSENLATKTTVNEPQIQIAKTETSAIPATNDSVTNTNTQLAALENNQSADELQVLAEQGNAAEIIRSTIARLEEDEARAAKARLAKAKQQERTQARLARALQQQQTLAAGTHRVTDGDTMYNISQRYNISVADLATINNIRGNNIQKGQVLKVAANTNNASNIRSVSYTVRKGDTLNTIANRFNVNINDIRRWNKNTRTVTPGQRINLIGI